MATDTDGREIVELLTGLLSPTPTTTDATKKKYQVPAFQYVPPDYTAFNAATGFGYNNPNDQMKDAFSIPTRGAGVFMGNKAPRYGTPAPQQSLHGNILGLLQQFMKPQGQQGVAQPFQLPGARGLLGK